MELLFQAWLICTLIFTAASESGHSSLVPVSVSGHSSDGILYTSVGGSSSPAVASAAALSSYSSPSLSSSSSSSSSAVGAALAARSSSSSATAEARAAEQCQLPGRWEGSWFQSGVHQTITINRSTISTKGRCLESEGEKYLLKNEEANCYRCVVFHEKHLNVLQYKETFCIPARKPLRTICSTISGDANLFSMFRLDGSPINCPFKGPLTFTYNRGHGECRYPVSTIESCIHSSRVLLNYQACPDVPGTESAVEELQCFAEWKEGSFRYLLGLIQYRHHASYEERFRCFAYEKSTKGGIFSGNYGNFANNSAVSLALGSAKDSTGLLVSVPAGGGVGAGYGIMGSNIVTSSSSGTGSTGVGGGNGVPGNNHNNNGPQQQNADPLFRVAQSGDATCNGLTPMEGSRTMVFRKGTTPKPCQFPSWVQAHTQWHTLDQRSTFSFDSSTLRVSNSSDPAGISPSTLAMTAVCHQILDNPTLDKVMLVLQSTSECRSGYICSALYKRDGHIVEMQLGAMARRPDDACHFSYFNQSLLPYVTLVSSTPETRQCPNLGQFQVTGLIRDGRKIKDGCSSEGFTTLRVGCSSLDTLQFRAECPSSSTTDAVAGLFRAEYSCHGWWEEMGVSYLITTPLSRTSTGARRYCFVFRETLEPQQDKLRESSRRLKRPGAGVVKSSSLLSFPSSGSRDGNEDSASSSLDVNPEYSEPEFKRILHFSSIADSCRRNVAPGIEGNLAFNVTSHGRCDDISSGASRRPGAAVMELGAMSRRTRTGATRRLTSYPGPVIIILEQLVQFVSLMPVCLVPVVSTLAFNLQATSWPLSFT